MKICVFSDAHGNIEALNNLSKTDDFINADYRIFLGDAVNMCPYPNECCQFLLENNIIWLAGNHDLYDAIGLPKEKTWNPKKIEHINYMSNKLLPKYKEIITKLPKQYTIIHNNKKLYFTHYAYNDIDFIRNPITPTLELTQDIFKEIDADYIFFGHDHHTSTFKDSKQEFICVGSIGMTYHGQYVVINCNEQITIEHKTIDFDLKKLQQEMFKQDYPRAKMYIDYFE